MEHILLSKDNYILKRIIIECLRNNGAAFTLGDKFFLQFHWSKVYKAKRALFGMRWAFEQFNGNYEGIKEAKKLLSELPIGITYQKKDVITQKLSEQRVKPFGTAWESHVTSFSIYVPTDYSQMIVNQNNGHKIVVIGYFENNIWQDALKFKERVLSSHSQILEPLFDYGFMRGYYLTDDGFTNFDGYGYSLRNVEMQPLQNQTQILGLMLALREYGERFVPYDQIWIIDNGTRESIYFSQIISPNSQSNSQLNEW